MASRDRKVGGNKGTRRPLSTAGPTLQSADAAELRRLAQNLQIHEEELEIQNEALRTAQRELETSRDRFAALYDFAPVGYATVNDRGEIREANLALAGMLATERANLLGRQFVNLVVLRERQAVRRFLAASALTSGRRICDTVLLRRDDEELAVQLIVEQDASSSPDTVHHRIAIVDIAEKAEAQRVLRENKAVLESALKAGRMVAWSWNLISNKVEQSTGLGEIFGLQTPDTYKVHGSMVEDIHPDDLKRYRETVGDAIARGGDYVVEFRITPSWQTKTYWLEEHGRVLQKTDDQTGLMGGVVFDITARKTAEEGMKTNYQRLEALIVNSSDPVALLSGEGRIECISKMGALMLGYEPDELVGKGVDTIIHADDVRLAGPQYAAIQKNGKPAAAMLRVREKSGALCWIDADVSIILPNSTSTGYVATFRRVAVEIGKERRPGPGGTTGNSGAA